MPDHDTDWTLTDKQSNDPDLKLVKQWLTDGQRPEYNEVSGLQADVRAYVAGCDKCAMRKTPTKKKRAPMAIVETSSPMERLATDILWELPETENGNRYILVVSDYYTKWTESFPMPNMEASTVVKIIVEEVIARFGVPSWIHSDQGRQYESRKDDDSESDKEESTSKSKELLSDSSESESEDDWKSQDPGDILGQDSDENECSEQEEKKDTGLKEPENKKDDNMMPSKLVERTVVCNNELGRIIRQKTTPRLPGVRNTFTERLGPEIIAVGSKNTDTKGSPVDSLEKQTDKGGKKG
ncbi:Hypothetical predicted protein [Mytilus galloprovincialis]|uniref:Integrase catalytic domain-containing protein n=1 Tax=Mytilus galloprovincialis TaxID=29158 RepID=A0A8B6BWW9_MYTGA|nr:Hypothetical predicted protein [Mytilus galloprovincialis]